MDDLNKLVADYHPNPEVLKGISQTKLVATVAPTASGKTTIMRAAAKISPDIHLILGETTRKPRSTETPEVDYLFRNRSEVIAELEHGELVDVIIGPNSDLYCTRLQQYKIGAVNVMALVASTLNTFRSLNFAYFRAVFIVPETFERWQEWLGKHAEVSGWTDEQITGRLAEARQSYEIALADSEIAFVLNDEIDKSAKRFLQVANGQKPDDEEQAKKTAQENYQRLLQLTDLP